MLTHNANDNRYLFISKTDVHNLNTRSKNNLFKTIWVTGLLLHKLYNIQLMVFLITIQILRNKTTFEREPSIFQIIRIQISYINTQN